MKNRPIGALCGIGFLVVLASLALLGDRLWFVRSFDERVRVDGEIANQYALGPGRVAWFGTDALGSDVFAKCLYGARTTLVVGVIATAIGVLLGGVLGLVAGYRRGTTDRVVGVADRRPALAAGDRAGDRDDRQARHGERDADLARLARPSLAAHVHPRDPGDRPALAHRARSHAGTAGGGLRARRPQSRGLEPSGHRSRGPAQPGADDAHRRLHRPRSARRRRGGAGVPRTERRGTDADVGQADRREPQRHVTGVVGDGLPVPDAVPHRVVVQPHR